MAPSPPPPGSANTSPGAVADAPNNDGFRVIRKRNRIPLSCGPCRHRKLKCNRSSPCENCIKRNDAGSCSYATPSNRKKANRASAASNPDSMQDRIDKLENLVLSLMNNGAPAQGTTNPAQSFSVDGAPFQHSPSQSTTSMRDDEGDASDTEGVAKSLGVLHMYNDKSMFIGDGHWAAVLKDAIKKIEDLKNFWNEHKKLHDDQIRRIESVRKQAGRAPQALPSFVMGAKGRPLPELLLQLPARQVVDKLVIQYFNDYDPGTHILHPTTWREHYDAHWNNPREPSPAFVAQLFAICTLALQSYIRLNQESPDYRGRMREAALNFKYLCKEVLVLCDYMKPTSMILETWILLLHSEYTSAADSDVNVWVLVGMIRSIALRMGLHRDPKYYANITPFQAEMRRRLWTYVRQADTLFSFQVGLPASLKSGDTDAELPSNLYDADLKEAMTEVPPARPNTEWTESSYLIAKARISFVFGRVVEATHSIHSAPYEVIMSLDSELKSTYQSLPSRIHDQPQDDKLDGLAIVIQRIQVACAYHKALVVLHRKYLARARENVRYADSRRTCIDSAMALLRTQAHLHEQSKVGNRMQTISWDSSSLNMFDFLLAGSILCLDLFLGAQSDGHGRPCDDVDLWGYSRRDEMIKAAQKSGAIWDELKDMHMEAFKACQIIHVMLHKISRLRNENAIRLAQRGQQLSDGASNPTQQYSPPEEEKPEHSAAISLNMLSNSGMTPSTASTGYSAGGYPPTPASNGTNMADPNSASTGLTPGSFPADIFGASGAPDPLAFFGNGITMEAPSNLDWSAWDSYMHAGTDTGDWVVEQPPVMPEPLQQNPQQGQSQQQQQQPLSNNMFQNPGMGDFSNGAAV